MRNDRFPCGLLILAVAVLKNPCAAAVTQPVQTQEVVMAPQDVSIALNRPSRESEVQRAPADGQQLDTNPPVFVWLPVEGAKGYILQYSQDPKFRDASTATVKKTSEKRTEHEVMPYQGPATVRYTVHPVTMHVLNRPLLPGKWYWRYGVDAGGSTGVVFGKTRAFSIRPDATAIPFPDVKQIIARLSRMRPRILVTPDSVAHLRELGRTTMKAEIDAMKRDCDPSVGQRLLPEPAFVPADTRDPAWGPEFIRVMNETRHFSAPMVECAELYLLTGDEKYGQEAKRRLLHIASWDPNGSTSLGNNDEPGKDLIQRMASVYDYVYPLLSEPERKVVRRCFSIRMHQLYLGLKRLPFEVNPFDSHAMGSYLDHLTEACIAMAGELDVEEPLEYCLMMLWAPFFPPYGGADGGWSEGPGYWGWSVADWLRDFRYVEQATGVPIHQRAWLRNTGYFELYGNPPYSKLSPFGDGSDTRGNGDVDMWELARTFHNPYFKWYADQLKYRPHGLLAFLDYGQEVAGKAPHDLPQGRCFNDVGLACMHDYLWDGEKNVEVLMRSSPYGSISHSYADQNAFVLSGYGEPLAISSGYYPYYGSPHHRGWTWQTKAANSIGVDGEGQQIRDWNAKGRILHFESNDYYHYALGDATAAYRGRLQRFYRHILYVRPLDSEMTPIVVIYDDLISRKKSTFQWWLHALEQMRIDGASQSVEIKRNQAQLDVRFLAPISLRFSQTDQFTIPPEGDADQYPNQWHLTAETTEPSESCRFLTVFFPHKVDQRDGSRSTKLLSGRGYLGVEVVAQGRRHVIAFRVGPGSEEPLDVAGLHLVGAVGAASWGSDGKPLAKASIESGASLGRANEDRDRAE